MIEVGTTEAVFVFISLVLAVITFTSHSYVQLVPATLSKNIKNHQIFPRGKKLSEAKTTNEAHFFPLPEPDNTLSPQTIDNRIGRDYVFANSSIRYPYHQTMAHQPMRCQDWVEPDKNYKHDLECKRRLIQEQGKVVLDVLPEAEEACGELLQFLSSWICARYPLAFEIKNNEAHDTKIENKITGQMIGLLDIKTNQPKKGIAALEAISGLVQDDYLISMPKGDGSWYSVGGIVAFPGFYLLSEKIGKNLHDVHAVVPQFNQKLLTSVERFLTRLKPEQPYERTSWEIVDSEDDQFWVPIAGPLPTDSGAKITKQYHETGRLERACETEDPAKLVLRMDHQTFVKMPKSGAVFFGVKPSLRKLETLSDIPLLPELLRKVHTDSQQDLMEYKAAPLYNENVLPYLTELHQKQIHNGLISAEVSAGDFKKINKDLYEKNKKLST